MPRAPRKCSHPPCEVRGHTRYCPEHTPQAWATSTRGGSTRASRKTRELVLLRDPVCTCQGCQRCSPQGCQRASVEDDHLVPVHKGGSDDTSNRRGICKTCHSFKTQREAAQARG